MSEQHSPAGARDLRDDGNRKPFRAVIVDSRGEDEAEQLAHARPTLDRWLRSGLGVALVCSRQALRDVPDPGRFAVVTDEGRERLSTEATVRLLGEANLRLDTTPQETLVVARAPASVSAAEALGFRHIVGIGRGAEAARLLDAGARSVIDRLRGLRFPRALPPALGRLEEIAAWCSDRPLAVFLDYDGTLTPIVAHPADAVLAPEMRAIIARLAACHTVAVISGRDRADVTERVGLEQIHYAGSHGLDIGGPGTSHTAPGADAAAKRLKAAAEEIRQAVGDVPGVVIEVKRFSVAVHHRQVAPELAQRVVDAAMHAGREWGLEVRRGKQVRELVPKLDWHKGRALEWLCAALQIDPAGTCVIYIGDDETDEDAFRALGTNGIGLRPGPRVAASLADYHLTDVNEVRAFLEWLAERPCGSAL